MTSGIHGPGGPGGIGGPGGPTGPAGADDAADVDHAAGGDRAGGAAGLAGPEGGAGADPIVALAADLDAGRITPDEALARLLDDGLGGELEPAARAELESLFADLLANDPYLAGLARDVGAAPAPDGGEGGAGGLDGTGGGGAG